MRPLKFRGKISAGLENAGQWVYWGIEGTDLIDAIDKDTIGQFTGLLDKHGKEIWEGDKLRGHATGRVYTVFFKDGAFFARSGNIILTRTDFHNNEVIGNIFTEDK